MPKRKAEPHPVAVAAWVVARELQDAKNRLLQAEEQWKVPEMAPSQTSANYYILHLCVPQEGFAPPLSLCEVNT